MHPASVTEKPETHTSAYVHRALKFQMLSAQQLPFTVILNIFVIARLTASGSFILSNFGPATLNDELKDVDFVGNVLHFVPTQMLEVEEAIDSLGSRF